MFRLHESGGPVAGSVGASRRRARAARRVAPFTIILVLGSLLPAAIPFGAAAALAAPASVTIAGDLQSEIGCGGDWDPACAATHLAYDATDDVWQGTFSVPAGNWQYKAAIDDSWAVNYGLHAVQGGDNIPLTLAGPAGVKFYYDDKTHWVTDNQGSIIATVPGDFQAQLGCPADWDPACLRSWLEDPGGSGTYSFTTTALLAGSYHAKVAINESMTENYGQGGAPGGANIAFTVPTDHAKVQFAYDPSSHVLTILSGAAHDNNVEWDGLRHDSRDTLYRTPGGAVPAGTPVTLRFRTFHDDVTSVKVRYYSVKLAGQQIVPMSIAASDVSCYQPGLESSTCDFWQTTLPGDQPTTGADVLWYRFVVTDGTKTVYYADDTAALDGGLGAPSDDVHDNSWALMRYVPTFSAPAWAHNAVIYQIFPDRFRNGRKNNDPKTGDARYDDPVLSLPWGTKPEGYCRDYADASTSCPWRFGPAPAGQNPTVEQPRGRDYFGGDLRGIDQNLPYLKLIGVNTLYLNPIFDSASNHGYDTRDFLTINPYFGTEKDWDNLVKHADLLHIRIVLDGVFNHVSSDSPFFDRYGHFSTTGACESVSSPYRSWFTFHDVAAGTGTCAGSAGANSATYDAWFGFDSLPVLDKSNPAVQAYFLTNTDSVTRHWLNDGASGWRLDVMGDASFPSGYWQTFRNVVKTTDPNALIIGELWQKDSTLLNFLKGDLADTTMDYRFRDAVLGFLAPQNFDPKGFPDSGHPLTASEFAARLASLREDYPDAAYFSLMNLIDSHDTERALWTLTPGAATTADRELNAANLAAGKLRLRLASLLQFTMPGAPTVYYGDEVGVTGSTDPDDRRTYPWLDLGGKPDLGLMASYAGLGALRSITPALTDGDFRVLLADDGQSSVAFGRKTGSQAAIVALNTSTSTQTLRIPVAGYLPDQVSFFRRFSVGGGTASSATTANGVLTITLGSMAGIVLATGRVDLTPTGAPTGLAVTGAAAGQASLAWNVTPGAASYNLYRSPVTGGGYVRVNSSPMTGTTYTDTGLRNGQVVFYVVRAVDPSGNESASSNEVSALPHLTIGWANLQWPPAMTYALDAGTSTDLAYGQVWIDGATNLPGPTPTLRAQLGFGPEGSNPAANPDWTWVDATFNVDSGNNDEFKAAMRPQASGTYDYLYRYSTDDTTWLYADLNGPVQAGALPPNPGKLTVTPSSDTTPPDVPQNLAVTSASPSQIDLSWDAVTGDPTLFGYDVGRSDTAGGPYTVLSTVTAATYQDGSVTQGSTYYYAVRSVDTAFNHSGWSAEVAATAAVRKVSVVFNVTVPATTDATGFDVHIAGTLDLLDGGLPAWNPAATPLTRVDATHWTITLTGDESTQIQYKYALGDWNYVEKDASCGEINNRLLTLQYGSNGTQTVDDNVPNWRNVAPCGN